MSVSTQSVPGHCHPAHIPPVHVASMVSDNVWCPRTPHVRAASLSSYSQDIFSSRPSMSGVQGHCMSAPSLTGPGVSGHVWRSGPDVQPHPAPRQARCMDRVRHGLDTPGTFPFSQSVYTGNGRLKLSSDMRQYTFTASAWRLANTAAAAAMCCL